MTRGAVTSAGDTMRQRWRRMVRALPAPALSLPRAARGDGQPKGASGNGITPHLAHLAYTTSNDPLYHKMIAATLGDPAIWQGVTASLRDAMIDFAIRHSPYYRERIRHGEPFARIPLLTKAAVRAHHATIRAAGVPLEAQVEKMTSGSTGEPMRFARDLSSGIADLSAKAFLHHLHRVPADAMTVWIVAPNNGGVPNVVDPSVHLVVTTDLTPDCLTREIALWQTFPSYIVYGYASAIEWVAHEIERRNLPMERPPVCVITTADLLTDPGRTRIARVMQCPVHSWYGSNEMGGYLAGTIPGTQRYIFNPLLAYTEVTDDDGRPLPAGVVGHLVVTHLNNYGFPLIRYDTGDRAALSADQCAGGFTVIEQLDGRSSDRLQFPSGKTLTAVTLGNRVVVSPGLAPAIRFFQCAQIGDNELELRIVWDTPPLPAVVEEITALLRTHTDPDTVIHVKAVDVLATFPSGKRWIVRDERQR